MNQLSFVRWTRLQRRLRGSYTPFKPTRRPKIVTQKPERLMLGQRADTGREAGIDDVCA